MKICVAGGAGYIGSHTAHHLTELGHEIVVLDNLATGHRTSIPATATFVHGDVADPLTSRRALKGCRAAVYLAALKAAGESMTDPVKYARANLSGTLSFLEACLDSGVEFVIFSSSAAVYGAPVRLPIDETHPTEPENFYGYTKLEIEKVLGWYSRLKGLKSASLRYFNAAGYDPKGQIAGLEQNPANLIPIVMEVACGVRKELQVFGGDYPTPDGTCIRDYIHVTDLARGHALALAHLENGGETFSVNLGTGRGHSVLAVAEAARMITGRSIPHRIVERRAGDPSELWASSQSAKDLLGWEAQHSSIEEILETTWNAYRKNGLGGN